MEPKNESPNKEGFAKTDHVLNSSDSQYTFLDTVTNSLSNFNASLAVVLVSIPITLSIVMSMNYNAKDNAKIEPTIAILTLMLGFILSFLISGGTHIFKTFTAAQAFIVLLQIRQFGAVSLPWTCLLVGVFIFTSVLLKLHRIVRITPNCVIVGIKISVGNIIELTLGILLFVNEISHGFGLQDTLRGSMNVYSVVQYLFQHQNEVQVFVFLTFIAMTTILGFLLINYPRVPWHAFFFIVSIIVGYVGGHQQLKTLGDSWNSGINWKSAIKDHYTKRINEHFSHSELLLEPHFILNTIALSIVTLLEACITMRLSDVTLATQGDKLTEIVGVGFANLLSGIFGLLPLSIPIGRNMLAHWSGAKDRTYLIYAIGLTFIFGWMVWPYMQYVPYVMVSVFNASLGVLLIDSTMIMNYWRYSQKYAIVMTLIVFSCFFLSIVFCMILAWVCFLAVYLQAPQGSYILGDAEMLVKEAQAHHSRMERKRRGRDEFEETQGLVSEVVSSQELDLIRIKSKGIVYKLRGSFNFMLSDTHYANLRNLNQEIVILDFSDILENDVEFILEYTKLIKDCYDYFELYVSGIPEIRVQSDLFLKIGWVQELAQKNRLMYIN